MLHRKWRQLCYLGPVFVLAVLLAACAGASTTNMNTQPADEATGPTTATLRVGWPGSPDTLNPGTGVLAEAYTIYDQVYDTLYDLQFDGTFRLGVAESVEVSDDGKIYTFKIRDNIQFHDGEALTAKDVAFSLNLYKDHEDFPFLNFYTLAFDT
ncbi:MAG: ABC transporter substrate-binding protein [Caldilineaceae bacterium]